MKPNVYYNAPYVDPSEHASINHAGIPGVGGGSGGMAVRDNAFLAQGANIATGSASPLTTVLYLGSIPDDDSNVTESGGVITINNTGIYAVAIYGNWQVDDSIETGFRLLRLSATNIPSPGSSGNFPFAAGVRDHISTVVPSSNSSILTFMIDFVSWIEVGTTFEVEWQNGDPAQASILDNITVVFSRLDG